VPFEPAFIKPLGCLKFQTETLPGTASSTKKCICEPTIRWAVQGRTGAATGHSTTAAARIRVWTSKRQMSFTTGHCLSRGWQHEGWRAALVSWRGWSLAARATSRRPDSPSAKARSKP